MKNVLITGATSGIGRATAELLAQKGYSLILCGRRKNILEQIKNSNPKTEIDILTFDITDYDQVKNELEKIKDKKIDILINNAGNAMGMDKFQDASLDDFIGMMDLNVKGLLYMTKMILPKMMNQGSGHIINIGSTAGKEVYPKGNVYCASKFAVDAISKALRIDLNGENIRVSNICPGLVETSFSEVRFKGDKEKADKVYQGFDALQAKDIANVLLFVIESPAHVTIADMVVLPTAQATSTIVSKNI